MLNFFALCQRGAKWWQKVGVFFVTGRMKLFFVITGKSGMKFGQKRQSVSATES